MSGKDKIVLILLVYISLTLVLTNILIQTSEKPEQKEKTWLYPWDKYNQDSGVEYENGIITIWMEEQKDIKTYRVQICMNEISNVIADEIFEDCITDNHFYCKVELSCYPYVNKYYARIGVSTIEISDVNVTIGDN